MEKGVEKGRKWGKMKKPSTKQEQRHKSKYPRAGIT